MLTEIEQQGLDINWFFTNNNEIAFVASAGGKVPLSIAKSIENNNIILDYFKNLPVISEVILNPRLDSIIPDFDEEYLEDFIYFSKRGLLSFDKTVLNNFSDTTYHLVAKPTRTFKINALPSGIRDLLLKTFYNGYIDKNIDSTSIS